MPETQRTVIDLGKAVKAKYPGAYDDLSDEEMGRAAKRKYPGAYDDFADITTATPQTPQKPEIRPTPRPKEQRAFIGPPTPAKTPAPARTAQSVAAPAQRPSPFPNVQAPMGLPATLNPEADIAQMDRHAQTVANLRFQLEQNPPGVPIPTIQPQPVDASLGGLLHEAAFGPTTAAAQIAQQNRQARTQPLGDALHSLAMGETPPSTSAAPIVDPRVFGLQNEIPLESNVPFLPHGKAVRGIAQGLIEGGTSFLTPDNLTLLGAGKAAQLLRSGPSKRILEHLISTGFGAQMLHNAIERSPDVWKAIKAGDLQGTMKALADIGLTAGMGVSSVAHGMEPVTGAATRIRRAKNINRIRTERTGTNTTGQRPGEAQTPAAPAQPEAATPPMWAKAREEAEGREAVRKDAEEQQAAKRAKAAPLPTEPREVKEWTGPLTAIAHYEALFDEADHAAKAKAGKRQKGERPVVPKTGIPENVARVMDARERLAQQLFEKPWEKVDAGDRVEIDDLIVKHDLGFSAREIPAQTPSTSSAAPAQTLSPDKAGQQSAPVVKPAQPTEPAKETEHAEQTQIRSAAAAERGRNEPAADTGRGPDVQPQPGRAGEPAETPARPESAGSAAAPVAARTPEVTPPAAAPEAETSAEKPPQTREAFVRRVKELKAQGMKGPQAGKQAEAEGFNPKGRDLKAERVAEIEKQLAVLNEGYEKRLAAGDQKGAKSIEQMMKRLQKERLDLLPSGALLWEPPDADWSISEEDQKRLDAAKAEGRKNPNTAFHYPVNDMLSELDNLRAMGYEIREEGQDLYAKGPDGRMWKGSRRTGKWTEITDEQPPQPPAKAPAPPPSPPGMKGMNGAEHAKRVRDLRKQGLSYEDAVKQANAENAKALGTPTPEAKGETPATGETQEAKTARKREQAKAVRELQENPPSDPVEWGRLHARTNPVGTSTQALMDKFPDLTYEEAKRIEKTVNAEKKTPGTPPPEPAQTPAAGAQRTAETPDIRPGDYVHPPNNKKKLYNVASVEDGKLKGWPLDENGKWDSKAPPVEIPYKPTWKQIEGSDRTPKIAFADAKEGAIIERASDGAKFRIVGRTSGLSGRQGMTLEPLEKTTLGSTNIGAENWKGAFEGWRRAETPPPAAAPAETKTPPAAPPAPVAAEPTKPTKTAAAPKPGTIAQIPTADLRVDPVRFQFKQNVGQKGVGEELKSVETFDPELAGIISVWYDPADGQTYVVNGHHRVELAQRTGYPQMTVRYLDAADAPEARAKGALINIAEGRGTPLDAAKVFRDMGWKPEDVAKRGVSMKGAVARQGMGLAALDQRIFDLVAQGEIPAETAAVIGEMLPERDADQRAVVDMIDKANARGKKMSPGEIREAIRVGLRPDQQLTETQETLFGDITQTRGLFAETGEISEYIRKKLNQEKRLFGSVGSESSAARLAGAGNVIKAEENARIAESAAQAISVYDKLSGMSGPVSDAIAEGARDLARGGNANEIKERTYEAVRRAISETFTGTRKGVLEGLPPGGEGGGGQTGSGEPSAEAPKEEDDQNLGLFGGRPTTEFMGFHTLASGIARGVKTFGEKDVAPTLKNVAAGVRDFVGDALTMLAPTLRTKAGERGSLIFRARLAELARASDQARYALRGAIRYFDRQKAADNYDFIDRMENGQKQKTPELDAIADTLRKLLDERRDAVRGLGKGKLQKFYENYFPHIWKDRRRAESIFAAFFGKRPLEGPKAFLKKRSLPTFADGINRGLEPVSDNPVDLVLAKLHEMDRFVMAHRTLADWKAAGLARFVDARKGKVPRGWKQIDPSVGTVYGPSVQNIAEYPNEGLYEALKNVVQALGLEHRRGFQNLHGAIGRAHPGGLVETAHGTKMGTLAHEIGHQIDWLAGSGKRFVLEYPDPQTVARLKRAYATLKDPNSAKADRTAARKELKALAPQIAARKQFAKELRDLADLRTGGSQSYRRSREEKMAQLAQMWAEGRSLFEKTAPTVFKEWKKFLDENPKLHALRDIEASANPTTLAQPYDVGGLVVKGHYYAPEGAALVMNNYLSPGLRRFAAYRGMAALNNTMNQAQLGLSAFHLGFVSADSAVSKTALAYQALLRGRPVKAAKYFAQAPFSPFTQYLEGRKGIREWRSPGTQGKQMEALVNALERGGGRISNDPVYQTDFRRSMMAAYRQGNVIGAALRAPLAANEALSNILMGHVVPAMKVGAALDLMRFHLGEMDPNASAEDVSRVLAQDWNSIENRLGEMTYDNLFWNRIGKDIAMLTVRSVGWNLGTLREIGGGIGDLAAQPYNALKGKPVNLNRLSYLAGLVTTTAAMNAIYQYLRTGKPPDELEDYFFPKNGAVDEQGRPQRSSPPTYIKDVYHYGTHPLKTVANKAAPVWSAIDEMVRNKDFYGNKIRNSDDPLVSQLADAAKYAAKTAIPIGVRNYQRETKLASTPAIRAEQFFGMSPAPAELDKTPAERLAAELSAERTGDEPGRPADAAERRELRLGLARALRAGKAIPKDTLDAIRAGKLTTRDLKLAYTQAHESPLEGAFSRLTIGDALKVYRAATADERLKLRGMLLKKGQAALKSEPPAARVKTLQGLREAFAVQ